jgi:gluconate kinase
MDELEEFARWYESELKKLENEKGIPLEKREKMGLVQQILESKKRIKEQEEASNIPCSSLSKIRL